MVEPRLREKRCAHLRERAISRGLVSRNKARDCTSIGPLPYTFSIESVDVI